MTYQSKKDETVLAKLISSDDKYKTSLLEYTTGEKAGQTFNVTEATLKRWWKKVDSNAVVETPEEEILHVDVVDDSGKSVSVDINPNAFVPGVDDATQAYDFNNQKKKYVRMPKAVEEIYMLDKDPYPTVEEVIDMMVSWGADIKAYAEWIKMIDGTKIIFRRNKRIPRKAVIEVRMKDERRFTGFNTEYVPVKSALIKDTPYVIYARTITDLEQVVRSIVTTQ